MKTTWRVTKVTETENSRVAELAQVTWFKKNLAYNLMFAEFSAVADTEGDDAADERFAGREWPDEFIDAEPGEQGAEFIDAFGTQTIDITDGLDLHVGDNVVQVLDSIEHIPA